MLPGRFIRVVVDFDDARALINEVKEGYLKASWREGESIKTGYVLVSRGSIVGALVEDIINGTRVEGEKALEEISRVGGSKRIKAVEVYEANVDEILRENPSIRVEGRTLEKEIPGWDLDSLLRVLTTHRGELKVHNGGTSWLLYLDNGVVKAARTIRGPMLRGNDALKNLLLEIGKVIRSGRYELGGNWSFSEEDMVQAGDVFQESLYLLRDKMRVEGAKGF
jgi:hypothetical protein